MSSTSAGATFTRRRVLVRSAALAVSVATLVAGCSSSGKGSSGNSSGSTPTGTGAGSTSSSGLSGTPIPIGVIGSLSGPQASSSSQGATVGPAWEKYVNANGGLNGHPVKVFVEDDGGDPAKAQAAEKKLVDSDKVVALLISSDNLVTAYDTDALSKGVPLISGTSNSPDWYTKPGMFSTVTDTLSGVLSQLTVAKQFGKVTKFGNLYCSEVAACAQSIPPQKTAAAKAGIKYTSLAVSSTATSYTAQCLQLQQQKVDFAQLNFTTAAAAKFIEDCQAQNYNPIWGSSAQAIGPALTKVKGATVFGPAYAFPSVAEGAPFAAFRDAMGKYAKDDNWKEGTASFTWSGLEVLRKALANVSANPTRADVMAALNSLKGEDLGGLLANKLTFTKGKPAAFGSQPCFFVIGIKDGKTIAPAGAKPVCLGA